MRKLQRKNLVSLAFSIHHNQRLTVSTARLRRTWDAPAYAFFNETVRVVESNGRRVHVFECAAGRCKKRINRYLDTGDHSSTSNLRKHVLTCWGAEALKAADGMATAKAARPCVEKLERNGTITAAFSRIAGSAETYSTRPMTKNEANTGHALWMAQSGRPFDIVEDPWYRRLAKTGRPDFPTPSAKTARRNLYNIFEHLVPRVKHLLKVSSRYRTNGQRTYEK